MNVGKKISSTDQAYLNLICEILKERGEWYREEYDNFLQSLAVFAKYGGKKPNYTTSKAMTAEKALRGPLSMLGDQEIASLQRTVEKHFAEMDIIKNNVSISVKQQNTKKTGERFGIPERMVRRWMREMS